MKKSKLFLAAVGTAAVMLGTTAFTACKTPFVINLSSSSAADSDLCTVTYHDGDTVLRTEQIKRREKATNFTPEAEKGFVFGKWSKANGEQYTFSDPVTKDLDLYAHWDLENYSVIFSADGENIAELSYTCRDLHITPPEVPEKYGYTGEWEDFELDYEDIAVSAIYTPIEYTISFYYDGEIYATVNYTIEDTEIIEPEPPEVEGFEVIWGDYELTGGDIDVNAVLRRLPTEQPQDPADDEENIGDSEDSETDNTEDSGNGGETSDKGDKEDNQEPTEPTNPTDPDASETHETHENSDIYDENGDDSDTDNNEESDNTDTNTDTDNDKDNETGTGGDPAIPPEKQPDNPDISQPETGSDSDDNQQEEEHIQNVFSYSICDGGCLINGLISADDTEIYIPAEYEGLKVIGIAEKAFMNNTQIVSLEIADGVTEIGTKAFYKCTSLDAIELPYSITGIGDRAFYNTAIRELDLNICAESISDYAFWSCRSLISVNIGGDIQRIEKFAFYECEQLESAALSEKVTYIGKNAFGFCHSLYDARFAVTEGWAKEDGSSIDDPSLSDPRSAADILTIDNTSSPLSRG